MILRERITAALLRYFVFSKSLMWPFLTVKLTHPVILASGEQSFSNVKQLKYYFTHLHVVGDTVQTCSAVKDAAFRLKCKDYRWVCGQKGQERCRGVAIACYCSQETNRGHCCSGHLRTRRSVRGYDRLYRHAGHVRMLLWLVLQ